MFSVVEHQSYDLSQRRDISGEIFPESGPVLVFDRSEAIEGEQIRTYLLHVRRANPTLVERMFNTNGEWILTDAQNADIYSMDPGELDSHLDSYTQYIGDLVQVALDGQKSYGFNTHDDTHFDHVVTEGLKLLKVGRSTPKNVLRRFVAAARGHDLGNVVSRRMHSTVSPLIFKRMFPSVERDSAQWEIISRAMELHDEKVLADAIYGWGPLNAEQVINRLSDLGPELLALLIADKTHVGPDRVPNKIEESLRNEAVNDPHIEVNSSGKTTKVGLGNDRKTFEWEMTYEPPRSDTKVGKRVSERLKRMRDSEDEPYFTAWENSLWRIYHARINLTVLSAYALYPQLENFKLILRDAETGRKIEQPFERKELDTRLRQLAYERKYAKKPKDRSDVSMVRNHL